MRDFYRLTDPELDPFLVENALSKIEAEVGPLLKSLDRERRGPNADELDALLQFMAVQWAQVPSFRPFALGILGSITKRGLEAALTNDETWMASLKEAGIAPDTSGADNYDDCKAFSFQQAPPSKDDSPSAPACSPPAKPQAPSALAFCRRSVRSRRTRSAKASRGPRGVQLSRRNASHLRSGTLTACGRLGSIPGEGREGGHFP